jgi:hypothetical protein
MKVVLIAVAIFGMFLVDGCKEEKIRYLLIEEVVEHPSRLNVPVPVGFTARDLGERLSLREAGLTRGSVSLEFSVLTDEPAKSDSPETRQTATGEDALFRETREDGGMGGPEYTLEAWRAASLDGEPAWIHMRAHAQREHGEPDFSLAWAIFDATSLGHTSKLLDD